MRIVIDTNVLASALFFGGKPAMLIRLLLQRKIIAVASRDILDEYQETIDCLTEKYGGKPRQFSITPVLSAMVLIEPVTELKVCRDPDDDKFLACAFDGCCDYVVSGDRDLLSIEAFDKIKILNVAAFLQEQGFC